MRYSTKVAILSVVLCCGCARDADDKWKSGRPKTVPARGTISLAGKPLGRAQIVLVPATGEHGGSGLSSENGSFSLASFPPDDGVVPGSYRVMIVKSEMPQNPDPDGPESTEPRYAKSLIPEKYTNPDTSELVVDIPDSGDVNIQLKLLE